MGALLLNHIPFVSSGLTTLFNNRAEKMVKNVPNNEKAVDEMIRQRTLKGKDLEVANHDINKASGGTGLAGVISAVILEGAILHTLGVSLLLFAAGARINMDAKIMQNDADLAALKNKKEELAKQAKNPKPK